MEKRKKRSKERKNDIYAGKQVKEELKRAYKSKVMEMDKRERIRTLTLPTPIYAHHTRVIAALDAHSDKKVQKSVDTEWFVELRVRGRCVGGMRGCWSGHVRQSSNFSK